MTAEDIKGHLMDAIEDIVEERGNVTVRAEYMGATTVGKLLWLSKVDGIAVDLKTHVQHVTSFRSAHHDKLSSLSLVELAAVLTSLEGRLS